MVCQEQGTSLISLLTDNQIAIADLCRRYRIRRLEVFGSAATGAFDPRHSDLDFVVDLGGYEADAHKRFFRFAEALESLLGRDVDLVTEDSIHNPYFRFAVDQSRELLYEAGDRQAIA